MQIRKEQIKMKKMRVDEIKREKVNPATGEIIGETHEIKETTIYKKVEEEEFIKIYYDTYIASVGGNHSSLSNLMMEIGKRMSYSKKGQIVILNKYAKDDIAESLGVTNNRVGHLIADCTRLGLLIRIDRGVYAVSPFIMAKGEWSDVKNLQLNYNKQLQQMKISAPLPKHLQQNNDKWQLENDNAPSQIERPKRPINESDIKLSTEEKERIKANREEQKTEDFWKQSREETQKLKEEYEKQKK